MVYCWVICRCGNSHSCVIRQYEWCGSSRHHSCLAILPDKLQKVTPHQRLSLELLVGTHRQHSWSRPPPQQPQAHLSAQAPLNLTSTLQLDLWREKKCYCDFRLAQPHGKLKMMNSFRSYLVSSQSFNCGTWVIWWGMPHLFRPVTSFMPTPQLSDIRNPQFIKWLIMIPSVDCCG